MLTNKWNSYKNIILSTTVQPKKTCLNISQWEEILIIKVYTPFTKLLLLVCSQSGVVKLEKTLVFACVKSCWRVTNCLHWNSLRKVSFGGPPVPPSWRKALTATWLRASLPTIRYHLKPKGNKNQVSVVNLKARVQKWAVGSSPYSSSWLSSSWIWNSDERAFRTCKHAHAGVDTLHMYHLEAHSFGEHLWCIFVTRSEKDQIPRFVFCFFVKYWPINSRISRAKPLLLLRCKANPVANERTTLAKNFRIFFSVCCVLFFPGNISTPQFVHVLDCQWHSWFMHVMANFAFVDVCCFCILDAQHCYERSSLVAPHFRSSMADTEKDTENLAINGQKEEEDEEQIENEKTQVTKKKKKKKKKKAGESHHPFLRPFSACVWQWQCFQLMKVSVIFTCEAQMESHLKAFEGQMTRTADCFWLK